MARQIPEEIAIRFSAETNSKRGKLIRFLKEQPSGPKETCIRLLEDCMQALALDKYGGTSPEELKILALQHACRLEGYARVLREMFQLPLPHQTTISLPENLASESESCNKSLIDTKDEDEDSKQINLKLERRRSMFG